MPVNSAITLDYSSETSLSNSLVNKYPQAWPAENFGNILIGFYNPLKAESKSFLDRRNNLGNKIYNFLSNEERQGFETINIFDEKHKKYLETYLAKKETEIDQKKAAEQAPKLPPSDPSPAPSKVVEDAKEAAKREEEKKKVSELADSLAEKARLHEQAALMMNIDQLIAGDMDSDIEKTYIKQNSEIKNPYDLYKAKKGLPTRKAKIYNNFAIFRSQDSGGGGHIDFTKNIYKNESLQDLLLKIPNKVLSSLIPSIKLYKVFYPSAEATYSSQNDCYIWRIPFDDIATNFPDKTSDFVKGNNNQQSLDEILNANGRLHSVGIKSFKYKFLGTNPAEINTNIEAELEIFLQDIRDLVKIIDIPASDANFINDLVTPPPNKNYTFTYADLVADSTRTQTEKGISVFNPEYFRIQAVIGYQTPTANVLTNLSDEEADILRSAIDYSKLILFLNPYSHDLQFGENGSVTIKIKYTAAITSAMTNIDVLGISDRHKKIKDLEKKIDKIKSESKKITERIERNCDNLTSEKVKQGTEDVRTKTEAELKVEQELLDSSYDEVYSELFSKLLGLKSSQQKIPNGKVYSVIFNKEALGISNSSDIFQIEEVATRIRQRNMANARKIEKYEILSTYLSQKAIKKSFKQKEKKGSKSTKEETDKVAKENTETEEQKKLLSKALIGCKQYDVKFVFLGDVLDVLLEDIKTVGPMEKPRIILSEFPIQIPRILKQKQENKQIEKVIYDKYNISIADIPLSLNALHQFFYENVVKTRRKNYPLNLFINDIITKVVSQAISPKVFGRDAILNKSLRMSMTTFSLNFDSDMQGVKCKISGKDINDDFNGNIIEGMISGINTTVARGGRIGNYLLIYASNQIPNVLLNTDRNLSSDKKLGVFHCYVGTDTGMIKKINFSKTTMPFYKEAKSRGATGNKSLLRLREVYDATIEMFGNNIFKPGDFLYIEPLFFSGRTASYIQEVLGLGGYYQVIDVETGISNSSYQTSLRCVLTAHLENNKVIDPVEGC